MLNVAACAAMVSTSIAVWAWYAWLPFDDEVPRPLEPKWSFEIRAVRFLIRAYTGAACAFLLLQLVCAVGFMTYLPQEGEWFRPDRRWLWLTLDIVGLGLPLGAWMAKIGLQDLRRATAPRPAPSE